MVHEESVTVSVMNGENENRLKFIYIYCSKQKKGGAVFEESNGVQSIKRSVL